jgi:mannose-1-phosphate guanylyltransferase
MIQETFDRANKKIPNNQIFVVTCEKYKNLVIEQLPNLPEENIVIEPVGRNTAPCILLSTLYINQIYPNANIAVLPSDHIISNTNMFLNTLETAFDFLNNNDESIITIGIKPDRPETGYGYIKTTNDKLHLNEMDIVKVEKFVEKPNLEKAKEYFDNGNYLWNAGMFVFNINYMLKELENNLSDTYELLKELPPINDKKYRSKLKENYNKCEAISIDYAVMEKSNSIYVIPCDFGWDDIGTWNALQRYIKPDEGSNIIKGDVKTYNSSNNVVYAGNKKIILLDVDDIFLIESDEMIVVGKKDQLSKVHELRNK